MSDPAFASSRWGAAKEHIGYQERIRELEAQLAALPTPGRKIALLMTFHGWQHEEILKQWIAIFWPSWGGGPFIQMRDLYVVESRNRVTAGLLNMPEDAWQEVLSLDSDHLPNPYLVQRIREHDGKWPVIGGTYYARAHPFDVQAWDEDPMIDGLRAIEPERYMKMLAEPGVYPVAGCGTGTMVIRRDVLEKMTRERGAGNVWHTEKIPEALTRHIAEESRKIGRDGSFLTGAEWSEDMQFCYDVRTILKMPVVLDTDPRLHTGHERSEIVDFRHWMAAHFVPGNVTLDTDKLRGQGMSVRDLEAKRLDTALERRARHRKEREERLARTPPLADLQRSDANLNGDPDAGAEREVGPALSAE